MQHATDSRVDPARPRADPELLRAAAYVDLAVAGMDCPHCGNRVRNALLGLAGVVDAEVDVTAGLAHVWFVAEHIRIEDMLAVVVEAGEATHHRYLAVPVTSGT